MGEGEEEFCYQYKAKFLLVDLYLRMVSVRCRFEEVDIAPVFTYISHAFNEWILLEENTKD